MFRNIITCILFTLNGYAFQSITNKILQQDTLTQNKPTKTMDNIEKEFPETPPNYKIPKGVYCHAYSEKRIYILDNYKADNERRFGLLDENGKEILPLTYEEINVFENRIIIKKEGLFALLDRNKKEILPRVYEEISVVDPEEQAVPIRVVLKKDGLYSMADIDGKLLFPFKYHDLGSFYGRGKELGTTLIPVSLNNKWGFIDFDGNEIVPPIYDYATMFIDTKYCVVELNKKQGVIDMQNNKIVELKYDSIEIRVDELMTVSINGKYGILKLPTQEIIVPIEFDYIGYFGWPNLFPVSKNEKLGYFDLSGKEVIPPIYDDVYGGNTYQFPLFNNADIVPLCLNGKYGYLNNEGKVVIDFQFAQATPFIEGSAKVKRKKSDKWSRITKNGVIIEPAKPFTYTEEKSFEPLAKQILDFEKKANVTEKFMSGLKVFKFSEKDAAIFKDIVLLKGYFHYLASFLLENQLINKDQYEYIERDIEEYAEQHFNAYYGKKPDAKSIIEEIIAKAAYTWFFDEYKLTYNDVKDSKKMKEYSKKYENQSFNYHIPKINVASIKKRDKNIETFIKQFEKISEGKETEFVAFTFCAAMSDTSHTDTFTHWVVRNGYALVYVQFFRN